jgi:hypothetical protein
MIHGPSYVKERSLATEQATIGVVCRGNISEIRTEIRNYRILNFVIRRKCTVYFYVAYQSKSDIGRFIVEL